VSGNAWCDRVSVRCRLWWNACAVPPVAVLSVGFMATVAVPYQSLSAQALDSTGMPSLELLALEAGRASRAHPIRVIMPTPLCETGHPLVDSASLAACASLPAESAAAIVAAFARGIEVPLGAQPESDSDATLPVCPTDLDRPRAPRVLTARVTAPVAGVHEGRWEGRLLVELRCRPPDAAGDGVRILGKEYLYQWSGSAWKMYQHSWLRAGR
jgi:hypothetical protein